MKMASIVKVAILACAVALPASFSVAEAKKLPPGACAVGKKSVLASGMVCSFKCDPVTLWCADQLCVNGQLTPALPCWGAFCPAKCGN